MELGKGRELSHRMRGGGGLNPTHSQADKLHLSVWRNGGKFKAKGGKAALDRIRSTTAGLPAGELVRRGSVESPPANRLPTHTQAVSVGKSSSRSLVLSGTRFRQAAEPLCSACWSSEGRESDVRIASPEGATAARVQESETERQNGCARSSRASSPHTYCGSLVIRHAG